MDLKFSAFSSEIEMPFYSALFQLKLDYDKLDDSARQIIGLYEPRSHVAADAGTKMQIHGAALTSHHVPLGLTRAEGMIKNYNTIEDFKNANKTTMLNNAGKQIWDAIQDGTIYSLPSLLSSFIVLSYADLKKYKFTYWFGFPALHSAPQWKRSGDVVHLNSKESTSLVDRVGTWRYSVDNRQHGFFLAKKVKKVRGEPPVSAVSEDPGQSDIDDPDVDDPEMDVGYKWAIGTLGEFEKGFFNDVEEDSRYVGFVDPSNYEDSASWPLRNLLILIRQRFRMKKVQIICYRDVQAKRHEARTIILPLAMDEVDDMEIKTMPKVTGWERNQNSELKARIANLAEYMDPARLADQAVDLNLKLMKWRIAPNLNLDVIRNTSCLLLGAGTLGSYVSRNLMGWGVKKITFVDYGKVSYSNPVRQPLFEFADCADGGKDKAVQAAVALKQIYPGVEAEGYPISVPMLGHPVLDETKTKADFDKLKQLINSHDAVFLLMDSRESRWLPTVMGKAADKIVLNAALGFDTYVVMRHGTAATDSTPQTLGCYFCNDVVVATDSMKQQTLDQQCTVTRPGVAAIASALLVELFASILQHPKKHHAPAPTSTSGENGTTYERDPQDHPLGIIPHQIRGFLHTFQNLVIRGQSYPQCSACSKQIVAAYKVGGWAFVKKALEDRNFVAELSGLAEVQRRAEAAAADVEWSEEEDGFGDDGEPVVV